MDEKHEDVRYELRGTPSLEPPPQDMWHLSYDGPRQVSLIRIFERKALIRFHGSIELVDGSDVYDKESAAYTAAWLRAMENAQANMNQAAKFKAKADELRKAGE